LNGERQSAPSPLPEALHGKTLIPMIAVRGASVAPNFGTVGGRPHKELPFKARMLDDAAAADVVASKVTAPASGKYDAIFPIGLPNEGTADFLDFDFYPKNSGTTYAEISARGLTKLCDESGLRGNPAQPSSYQVMEIDDGSMLRAYANLAVSKKRNVVVFDVAANLSSSQRISEMKFWGQASWLTKKAVVAVGTPSKAFTTKVQELLLEAEKVKVKTQVDNEKSAWGAEQRRKIAKGEEGDKEPDWEAKAKVDAKAVKDISFRPTNDLTAERIGRTFQDFSLPKEGPAPEFVDARWIDGKESAAAKGGDGFDAVEYAWGKAADAAKYLQQYQKARKVSEKATEEKTAYFDEQFEAFAVAKLGLKASVVKYADEKAKRAANVAQAEKAAAEAEKAAAAAEGEEGEKKEEETKPEEKKEHDVDMSVDDDAAPVALGKAKVDDIDGNGTPLCKDWGMEDWLLLQMRFELHLLINAFAKDFTAKDAERTGIPLNLLPHYYQFYFGHQLFPAQFGHANVEKMIEYCKDTVKESNGVLQTVLKGDMPRDALVKLVEGERRSRAAGADSLNFAFQRGGRKNDGGKGKGGGKGGKGAPHGQKRPLDPPVSGAGGGKRQNQGKGFIPGPPTSQANKGFIPGPPKGGNFGKGKGKGGR